MRRFYPHEDSYGPYTSGDLTAAGEGHGDSGEPWRGIDPTEKERRWAAPGPFPASLPRPADWDGLATRQKLDRLDELGLMLRPARKGGVPRCNRYLGTSPGQPST